jgi:hypothetical protein
VHVFFPTRPLKISTSIRLTQHEERGPAQPTLQQLASLPIVVVNRIARRPRWPNPTVLHVFATRGPMAPPQLAKNNDALVERIRRAGVRCSGTASR